MSLSGARNRPRPKPGVVIAVITSSFSVGSTWV